MAGEFLLESSNSNPPPGFLYWAVTAGGYSPAHFGTDQGAVTADYTTTETGRQAPHSPFTPESPYADADVGQWEGNAAVFATDRSDNPEWVRRFNFDLTEGLGLKG